MNKIHVEVITHERLAGEGILALLGRDGRFQVSDEVMNPERLVTDSNAIPPHVLIVFIVKMDDGLDSLLKNVKSLHSKSSVIVVSPENQPWRVSRLLQAGLSGYLLADENAYELYHAITSVAAGERYFSAHVSAGLLQGYIARDTHMQHEAVDGGRQALTSRELEIVRLLSGGHSSSCIAGKLHISPLTVNTHRKRILRKLRLTNTPSLVNYAFRHGLA
jgi:DNA-binding NarL/FixJ family response regulator